MGKLQYIEQSRTRRKRQQLALAASKLFFVFYLKRKKKCRTQRITCRSHRSEAVLIKLATLEDLRIKALKICHPQLFRNSNPLKSVAKVPVDLDLDLSLLDLLQMKDLHLIKD